MDISHLLLSWTFDAGIHQTDWGILERGIYGLAVLALQIADDGNIRGLKTTAGQIVTPDCF